MSLQSGTRLGPYEILELRGKGGMGEVYRALDTRLEREVAVKVLPERLSDDAEFRQRLEREAKTISQLSHPHICTLHDIGSENGHSYLVMELLEGETLEERLARGPLPIEQVLELGGQIAEAVEAAHRQGVVHRDLKPGNVMLTPSGVKVLDFGLAKGFETAPAGNDTRTPTATQPLTTDGSIVGTLHYMAPEQLEGKDADARSDLFALGVVLYEMICGERPFQGPSQASLIASIMTARPEPLQEKRELTPARLGWLVERCLDKDPERRLQSARDVALLLGRVEGDEVASTTEAGARRGLSGAALAAVVAAALLIGAGASWMLFGRAEETGSNRSERWTLSTLKLTPEPRGFLSVSPDGSRIAYAAGETGGMVGGQVFLRTLQSRDSVPLSVTVRRSPVFSPGGDHLLVVEGEELRRFPLDGGVPTTLVRGTIFGMEGADGLVYYSPAQPGAGIVPEATQVWRVPEPGGEPERISDGFVTPGGVSPDGQHLLATVQGDVEDLTRTFHSDVVLVDLESGESQVLFPGLAPTFLESDTVAFYRSGGLWAARVDVESAAVVESPRVIVEGVARQQGVPIDLGEFSIGAADTLVYRQGGSEIASVMPVWVGRDGAVLEELSSDPREFGYPTLSPDGRLASFSVVYDNVSKVEQWVLDLESGLWSRPAHPGSVNHTLSWLPPDGAEVVYGSNRSGAMEMLLYIQPADLSSPAELLFENERAVSLLDPSPDGRSLVYTEQGQGLFAYDLGSGESTALIRDRYIASARFHPSGEWIVYPDPTFAEPGIWARPYGRPGPPVRLTDDPTHGEVRWSRDGTELFFRDGRHFFALPVKIDGARFERGQPVPLFEDRFARAPAPGWTNYNVTPDGRFLAMLEVESGPGDLILIQNWRAMVAAAFDEE